MVDLSTFGGYGLTGRSDIKEGKEEKKDKAMKDKAVTEVLALCAL